MSADAVKLQIVEGGQPYDGEPWPEPLPIPDGIIPVEAFEPDLLPDALRPWVMDVAERMQCPIDFPAIAAMTTLSASVGRLVGVKPKSKDDWTVVPNLWGMVVGRPGVMKTPAIQEMLKATSTTRSRC